MITDFLLAPLIALVGWVIDQLPDGDPPALPSLDPLWSTVTGLDSLVPVSGPLLFMLGLLLCGVAFVIVRLVLTVWNLIWP